MFGLRQYREELVRARQEMDDTIVALDRVINYLDQRKGLKPLARVDAIVGNVKRRKISKEHRKALAEGRRAYWRKYKAEKAVAADDRGEDQKE